MTAMKNLMTACLLAAFLCSASCGCSKDSGGGEDDGGKIAGVISGSRREVREA